MLVKKLLTAGIIAFTTVTLSQTAQAHCEVPCGIYDDGARIIQMLEDAKTVEKATKMMNELAGKTDAQSANQMTRWVVNKEAHAQKVITTISDYFLTQRVKSSQKDYTDRLVKHHSVIVAAMKAKQNADGKYATALTKAIMDLVPFYHVHLEHSH
ncbi:superoxide dismutase [Ni] [Lentisphaera profundi]|uniref:Superoxide dismutase [Ni] n=1 Tax=Lentisphaera profundi TaxID=1658616 RepID=A0ABY7W0K6_9BACT|nr:superoxide dismutase [Ni] [Lentisphaera profundi]WDE99074.1 superoxide dismutase [Ni] [Lentisphaera profundi]